MKKSQFIIQTLIAMKPKLPKQSTLVLVKSSGRLNSDAHISTIAGSAMNKVSIYKFNKKSELLMPLEEAVIYRNGSEIAEIDINELSQFPEYQHHLHTRTFNEAAPNQQSQQILITVNFLQIPSNLLTQGINVKMVFIDADILNDTETFGKMDPYLRVKVNEVQKWKSTPVKKGDKKPNFNKESTTIQLKNLTDTITIELWDKDMQNDDYIGGATLRMFELLGRGQEIIDLPIAFMNKNKVLPAGKIRLQAESLNII